MQGNLEFSLKAQVYNTFYANGEKKKKKQKAFLSIIRVIQFGIEWPLLGREIFCKYSETNILLFYSLQGQKIIQRQKEKSLLNELKFFQSKETVEICSLFFAVLNEFNKQGLNNLHENPHTHTHTKKKQRIAGAKRL